MLNTAPLANYHSHTTRCQHATGTEEAYVLQAIESGYSVMGFADHTPWPYASSYVSTIRMTSEQFPDYVSTVRALGEKYAGQIHIPLGLECEFYPAYMGWLSDLKAQYLDYLILGNHFGDTDENGSLYFGECRTLKHIQRYVSRTVAGMETGVYAYLAHPDLYFRRYPTFDADCRAASRDLCAAAKQLNIPLEYNLWGLQHHDRDLANGGLGYPYTGFWELAAEVGCTAVIGIDAHHPYQIADTSMFTDARAYFKQLGMNVVDSLDV